MEKNSQQQTINLLPIEDEEKKGIAKQNIRYLIFYSLSVTIAVSVSNIIISIMDSLPKASQILFKILYILILVGATIYITFVLGENIKK